VSRGKTYRPAKPSLMKWTPRRSGALLGFCSVQLPSGMILNDLRIMTGRNGLWVAMPAQKQLDRDGQPRLDANGKPIYSQIVEFKDKPTPDRFRAMVLELARAECPGDLDEGAAAACDKPASPARSTQRPTSADSRCRPAASRVELGEVMPSDPVDDLWPDGGRL